MTPAKQRMYPDERMLLAASGTAVVYYGLARAGLGLALAGTASCPVWPASGLALVAAVFLGPGAGLGVFMGSWLANWHALPGLGAVAPPLAALACAAVALGSALQALAGARLLRNELGGPDPLSKSRDVIRFAALTPVICLLSASVGVGALFASGLLAREIFAQAWLTWWIGDLIGVLVTAPLLLAWRPRGTDEFGEPLSPRRALTAAWVVSALWLSVWLGFGDLFPPDTRYPLSYLPFTALLWITLRLDSRGATAGAAVLAALVQWHTIRGVGPFAVGRTLNESLLLSSAYIGAAALTAFLLRALLSELGGARAALERVLTRKNEDLVAANAHLRVAALTRREDTVRIQLYRRIFGELPVGLSVLRVDDPGDPEGWRIVELNPAGLRLSAAEGEDPGGRLLFEFAPELRDTDLPRACAEAVRLNRGVDIPDLLSRERVPGARFSVKIFPLGAPFVGIAFEDITARKAAEAALARSNAELSQFAYVASHDLQTPLRKAAAFAEQLRLHLGAALDETSRDFMERMERSIEGMQALIDSLLELARVATSAAAPRKVDLAVVAAEVLGDLEDSISLSGARIHRSFLPVVMGDPHQMRQLLQNLIGNAIKFTAPDKTPVVRLRGRAFDDGRCELVVEDDGVGFDM
ncbi:MAG: MASE1 domain-containing protein, partial [Elusimicrobia bacterium]|nr:MASE1 domain-containing protein [Elusimicrobiota bacterium]